MRVSIKNLVILGKSQVTNMRDAVAVLFVLQGTSVDKTQSHPLWLPQETHLPEKFQ